MATRGYATRKIFPEELKTAFETRLKTLILNLEISNRSARNLIEAAKAGGFTWEQDVESELRDLTAKRETPKPRKDRFLDGFEL